MKKSFGSLVLSIAALLFLVVAPVGAQSNGLGISPRKDYSIKPGNKISDTLFISNLSQTEDLTVAMRVVDFKSQDETGTPALQLDPNTPQTAWSMRPFITFPEKVTIKAGKSTYVPFTISIPASQGAGSYYSAIEYVAQNATAQKNVNLSASSATLVFVNVPGEAHEGLTLLKFGAFAPNKEGDSGKFRNFFFASQPKVLAYRLQNNGNVAEHPAGSILVKNMFGQQKLIIKDANPKNSLALIGQTRRFEVCLKTSTKTTKATNGQDATETFCDNSGLFPGRYTAEMQVLYGLNGSPSQQITAKATFWYLPIWFLVAVVAVIAVVAFGVWRVWRKLSHRTHRAVRR